MTEKIQIDGKDVWVTIEPHALHVSQDESKEYFTASYQLANPLDSPGMVLLLDEKKEPMVFDSPVAALEFASEKLLGLV